MEAQKEKTISYDTLTDGAQYQIDIYPEEQSFTFYARRYAKGYQVRGIPDHHLDLLEAQGGMGRSWMRVTFGDSWDSRQEMSTPALE
ncbi:hypothetical protein [Ktedonobacter racemifer]|uniref:Uncharacterized protein n=1 Tax=Ktedonobacter racemifer DSM 44963 TaxID=485913 RepID=D6U3H4_KTERA|nr:hypothetical protein [Ktedonobacter racemifer]EFH82964.1 hypothetical protein Krac_3863 [Ktedonobacter racemifer DSM 44963]